MLTWSEKISLMTQKGMSWKEVQELDKGLEEEKKNPPKEDPKADPKEDPKADPKEDPKADPKEDPKADPKEEPTENEKKLLDKINELETQLKEAQADNAHADNGNTELTFDEQLDNMFKDYRI